MSYSKREEPVANFNLTFYLFRACGPQHGQMDKVQFISPVNYIPCVLIVYKGCVVQLKSAQLQWNTDKHDFVPSL